MYIYIYNSENKQHMLCVIASGNQVCMCLFLFKYTYAHVPCGHLVCTAIVTRPVFTYISLFCCACFCVFLAPMSLVIPGMVEHWNMFKCQNIHHYKSAVPRTVEMKQATFNLLFYFAVLPITR